MKPILIKENQEFALGEVVFVYIMSGDGSIKLKKIGPLKLDVKKTKTPKSKPTEIMFVPPTLDEAKVFFMSKGYTHQKGEEFFNYYHYANPPWTDKGGNPVKSWRQKAISQWMKSDEGKIKPKGDDDHLEGLVF